MCLICVEYQKGSMTLREARRNAAEVVNTAGWDNPEWDHAVEILENLTQEPEPDEPAIHRLVNEGGKDRG